MFGDVSDMYTLHRQKKTFGVRVQDNEDVQLLYYSDILIILILLNEFFRSHVLFNMAFAALCYQLILK